MGEQTKQKSASIGLTSEEVALLESRLDLHGFPNRREYLLALIEVEMKLKLEADFDKVRKASFFLIDRFTKNGATPSVSKAQK